MNFRVDFGAEDEVRLSPFKDDNPKDTENSTFEASSLLVVKAKQLKKQMFEQIENHCCKEIDFCEILYKLRSGM